MSNQDEMAVLEKEPKQAKKGKLRAVHVKFHKGGAVVETDHEFGPGPIARSDEDRGEIVKTPDEIAKLVRKHATAALGQHSGHGSSSSGESESAAEQESESGEE